MKIAFVLFDGFSAFDFASLYEPLTRLKSLDLIPDLTWDICADQKSIKDAQGMQVLTDRFDQPLNGYDLVVIPGIRNVTTLIADDRRLNWLLTAGSTAWLAAVGSGSQVLAAAGLLKGKHAAADEATTSLLTEFGAVPVMEDVVEEDGIFTAAGSGSALQLGWMLCAQLAGMGAAQQVQSAMGINPAPLLQQEEQIGSEAESADGARFARVVRKTRETNIEIELDLDGSGQYTISTGLPFFDHMLAQLAVHGLFDLDIKAEGDLQVDAHHTVEDVALALGDAFAKALGERKGIVRMASASCPMDETLAQTVVDFSGRPYAVIQVEWTASEVGGISTTLFTHFLESLATQARSNLHVQVMYGRDDHHKAEAIFKSLGRALDAATRIDERRGGDVPSTKGVLA